jgi:dipeptidyl-peptidase-3
MRESLMHKLTDYLPLAGTALLLSLAGCSQEPDSASANSAPAQVETAAPAATASAQQQVDAYAGATANAAQEFQVEADRFADKQILRYQIPGWDGLSLQQKTLLYYLSQAGMSGRDIMWDQNYKHNLRIRKVIEQVIRHYPGDRSTEEFGAFMTWAKQVFFSNGIHHHYSNDKFEPEFTAGYFAEIVNASGASGDMPVDGVDGIDGLLSLLNPVIFDPAVDRKKVNLAPGIDKMLGSAVNFYDSVTEQDVVDFYAAKIDPNDQTPVSWGLNSQLVKNADGEIVERVWKVDGMYGQAIEQVVYWLEKAVTVAETPEQKKSLELLVQYYRSGDLKDFDDYSIAWVQDTEASVDATNGFIEVYNDPLGYRGSFESVVSFRNEEATRRIATLARYAQRFEDESSIMDEHKRENVVGITGKAITVVSETGDASPSTPVGINLPNANWIRAGYGSKSVALSNINDAYDAVDSGSLAEFTLTEEEYERGKAWNTLAGHLRTDMHEVIGHASGKINPGVGTPKETLKQYASAMEEGRADLVALYYMLDPFLVEIGVLPDREAGMAAYDFYIRRGLMTQLQRIKPGDDIEEAHMRNRQEIAAWVYEHGKDDNVIERITENGKTYFRVNDYERLRELFGELLREHQRIKSEGDFAGAEYLIETYGTKVDQELHAEVLERYAALDVASYSGFINPKLVPVMRGDEILDVRVEYPDDFVQQMLDYADEYAFLPVEN